MTGNLLKATTQLQVKAYKCSCYRVFYSRLAYCNLQVATILVAMAPKILQLVTWFEKVSLNQESWLPNGDWAKTLTWRVVLSHFFGCIFEVSQFFLSALHCLNPVFKKFTFNKRIQVITDTALFFMVIRFLLVIYFFFISGYCQISWL